VRGAWRELGSVVVNLDGQPQRLNSHFVSRHADSLTDLARIVAGIWTGSRFTRGQASSISPKQHHHRVLAVA
jgi:hypothetical protein